VKPVEIPELVKLGLFQYICLTPKNPLKPTWLGCLKTWVFATLSYSTQWSRSTRLLCAMLSYFLDGWLSADR